MGVLPMIMKHLSDKNENVVLAALAFLKKVMSGNEFQKQHCMHCNIFLYLEQLVNSSNETIIKESLFCLSNLVDDPQRIQVE